jgi:hypothetical protein
VVEDLVGQLLVAVERLSWNTAAGPGRRDSGPVRLVFNNGRGLDLQANSDWTLSLRVTGPGDDSWLDAVDYEVEDGRWVLRDAATEPPLADAVGTRLTDWQPVQNEVNELVGLHLWSDQHEVPFVIWEGEVTT